MPLLQTLALRKAFWVKKKKKKNSSASTYSQASFWLPSASNSPFKILWTSFHFLQWISVSLAPGTSYKACLLCLKLPSPVPKHIFFAYYSSFIFRLECHFLRARHSHASHMCSSNCLGAMWGISEKSDLVRELSNRSVQQCDGQTRKAVSKFSKRVADRWQTNLVRQIAMGR